MTNLLRKPLFWTNVAALLFVGFLAAGLAWGWTNPSSNPPGGSGAITADSLGNVGIGTASPTQRLDVIGNVKGTGLCIGTDCRTSWPTGSGSTAWSSITGKPPGFADDIDNIGFSSFTVTTAIGSNAALATCPAGYRIVAGACGSNIPVLRTSADAAGTHYLDETNNRTVCNTNFNVVYARCLKLQ